MSNGPNSTTEKEIPQAVYTHLRFGWWSMLVFLSLGILLEALHGFKVGFYLNVGSETRRLMWTLAHAHGVLLGLANVAFAATMYVLPARGGLAGRFGRLQVCRLPSHRACRRPSQSAVRSGSPMLPQ